MSDLERVRQDRLGLPSSEHINSVNVYELIHSIRSQIRTNIDSALSWEKLNAPDINFSILRPLLKTYINDKNPAIIYAILLNRLQFLRLAQEDLAFKGLLESRAMFCEILAMKLTRAFAASDLELIDCLTRPWNPFQGASESVLGRVDLEDIKEGMQNTLEVAIISSSKYFLSTPLLQRVISLIHAGTIVYHTCSGVHARRGLLEDGYLGRGRRRRIGLAGDELNEESHTVYLYNVRESGWLDTARLKVPFWRDTIEFINFFLLFISFVLCIRYQNFERIHWTEGFLISMGLGLALDEFAATKEHGLLFYSQSLFNGLDLSFLLIFFTYLILRVQNLCLPHHHREDEVETSKLAFDILACGAAILFPRLAFTVIRGKVIVLALKKMMVDFVLFMMLALTCFTGIFYALITLGKSTWTARSLAWLMAQIWFGSSYLSFQSSASFHPIFGPILLISYAALCNTLLVTILVSILSNRYAKVSENAREEQAFQDAVATVGGVKRDAIFSYIVPLNIIATIILGPLSYVLSPRTFHSLNVFLIRSSTFPLLLVVSLYERWKIKNSKAMNNLLGSFGGSRSDWIEDVFTTSTFSLGSNSIATRSDSLDLLTRSEELEAEISGASSPVESSTSETIMGKLPSDRTHMETPIKRRKTVRVQDSQQSTHGGSTNGVLTSLTSPLAKLFRSDSYQVIMKEGEGGKTGSDAEESLETARRRSYDVFLRTSLASSLDELLVSLDGSSIGQVEEEPAEGMYWVWIVNYGEQGGDVEKKREVIQRLLGNDAIWIPLIGLTFSILRFPTPQSALSFVLLYQNQPLLHPASTLDLPKPLYVELACPTAVLPRLPPIPNTFELEGAVEFEKGKRRWPCGIEVWEDFISAEEEAMLIKEMRTIGGWVEGVEKRLSVHFGKEFDYSTNLTKASDHEMPAYMLNGGPLDRLPYVNPNLPVNQMTGQIYPAGTGIPPHVDTHSPFGEVIWGISLGSTVTMELKLCGEIEEKRMREPKRCLTPTSNSNPIQSSNTPLSVLLKRPPLPEVLSPDELLLIDLPPRSLLVMKGPSRYGYTHHIRPRKLDPLGEWGEILRQREERYSLTFRSVKTDEVRLKGCLCEWDRFCDSRF
ncbi:Uncharacterized conserved protein [Phaffia rhodozyma]|uniref:Uncharacterized conserved protein n=1 Tax=Phaffia rhodozyma TaxID=264483 RepID=A0A0F7SW15_PHARH|nr:Uncharacterized conserved protein [Phaffia rhodozyma]